MIVRFTKEDRSTFPYWFAHWCAYQMVALNLKLWKPRYLLHDFEKPWMLLWFKYIVRDKNPYKRVQQWHHRKHHIEYPKHTFDDYVDMLVNWECSRFTKQQAKLTAREEIDNLRNSDRIDADDSRRMRIYKRALIPLGFKYVSNNGSYLIYKWKIPLDERLTG